MSIARGIRGLDAQQAKAVLHDDHTVVLAGPGSGKTATLVLKVAYLVERVVRSPRGVACITFNNDAVGEFRARLAHYGIRGSRRLFLGTVHSFCLNGVVRPYASLVDPSQSRDIQVASEAVAGRLLIKHYSNHISGGFGSSIGLEVTRFRRRKACGEDVSGFDDRLPRVVRDYENALKAANLIDFDSIVICACKLLQNAWIRDLVASRFPWLVVDEYQDLGGPLHKMVELLIDRTSTKVFAVGDPDQTVYGFTGADPKYLKKLCSRDDFKTLRLRFNYRSGQALIDASQAALAPEQPRKYRSRPGRVDRGVVVFRESGVDMAQHASSAVEAVRDALVTGVRPEEIAILYARKTDFLSELVAALKAAKIPFVSEREATFPRTPICRWLQQIALWSSEKGPANGVSFGEMSRYYLEMLAAGSAEQEVSELMARVRLMRVLEADVRSTLLGEWLTRIDEELDLSGLLARAPYRSNDDLESLQAFIAEANSGELVSSLVEEFAEEGNVEGKIALTTLHSSKGRQFDMVVLPGLAEGIMPRWRWNPSAKRMVPPTTQFLSTERRLFYVGFTRARKAVVLIYSDAYRNPRGYINRFGRSRFVVEIEQKLATAQSESV